MLFAGTAVLGVVLLPVGMPAEEQGGLWLLFHSRGAVAAPPDVVVVGIDETTERALSGPATRTALAELVDRLTDFGAELIVLDLFLHVPADGDAALADAMARAGNVIVTAQIERSSGTGFDVQALRTPIPELAERALGTAPWLVPETFRVNWVFPYDDSDRATIPLLALQAYVFDELIARLKEVRPAAAAELPETRAEIAPDRPLERVMDDLRRMFAADATLARDMLASPNDLQPGTRFLVAAYASSARDDRLYLNYLGPPRTLITVPYQNALRSNDVLQFARKVVFVGYSAQAQPGQRDDYPYVYSTGGFNLSGVEMGATAFVNLRDDRALRLPELPVRIVIVVLFGLAIAGVLGRLQLWPGLALAAVVSGAYFAAAFAAFAFHALWLPLVVPGVQLLYATGLSLRLRQLTERMQLGAGTSEEAALALTGRGKPEKIDYRVVLFADEQGSKKRLLRAMETLDEATRQALQRDFAATRDSPIAAHGGQINHVLGDSMLAHWITGESREAADLRKGARAACRAALAVHAGTEALDVRYSGHAPRLRIGLDWGRISSRLNPSPEIKDWRMEGPAIHTAERLESLNKVFGTATLVSHAVASHLDPREFLTHELGTFVFCDDSGAVVVEPVRVFELRAGGVADEALLATRFGEALDALRRLDWSGAQTRFAELAATGGRHAELAARYSAWCQKTLDETDTRWRGTIVVSFSDKSQYLDRYLPPRRAVAGDAASVLRAE